MEDKQVATVRTITGELIGGFFLYGIVFSILYRIISKILSPDSLILAAIIVIILQGIRAFCVWKCSIATTFRKRSININDVQIVMKNLIIFTIILFLISGVKNYSNINKSITVIEKMTEAYLYFVDDPEAISQYTAENEKKINELYTYLAILEIGLFTVYLGVVSLQKKAILKHAVYMEGDQQ